MPVDHYVSLMYYYFVIVIIGLPVLLTNTNVQVIESDAIVLLFCQGYLYM